MDAVAITVAAVAGALGGVGSARLADAVGQPRYGIGADGHDPEDAALAPLEAPTTRRQQGALAGVGALSLALLAAGVPRGEILLLDGALALVFLAAMVVDLQYLRLPNLFTWPAAAAAVAGSVLLSVRFDAPLLGIWIGALGYPGFLLVARVGYQLLRGREGMGLGDVKLAISLGATAGWLGSALTDPPFIGAVQLVMYAALLGNLLGAAGGLVLLRRFDREFPFGPALVAGWVIVMAAAQQLAG